MPISVDLQHLAAQLTNDGPEAHNDALRAVADWARATGASPVLAAIVASSDEPEVARLRAFGRLARGLDVTLQAATPRPELAA